MLNIRDKDLNLLGALLVIGEELNLSRAAFRLGLSQPTLSHALSRLRKQFGDPLFVRSQHGLVATPKVEALLPRAREVMAMADSLYGLSGKLDLLKLDRMVVIASTTYFEARAFPRFMRIVGKQAPLLRLETRSLAGGFPKKELESGELDLAVAAYFQDVPERFRIKTIVQENFVCVCSKRNAYLRTKMSAEDYLACRHLQIEVPPGVIAHVDRYLADRKKRREIAMRVGNFLTPARVLNETDLLLTCPRSLAESYAGMTALTVLELPFKLPPIETKMVWHEKNQSDPFHAWLRDTLASSGA
jgi:DNA-binding transcriptional LysR family regulator